MVLKFTGWSYGLGWNFKALENVSEWTCLIPKPKAIKVSIIERDVVTTECPKKEFLETLWRNCNFPIKSVTVLWKLQMYAIATVQIHKVEVQSNSVVIGAKMRDIWKLHYTSTKINQLKPVKVIQSHLLSFHPNLIIIKKGKCPSRFLYFGEPSASK